MWFMMADFIKSLVSKKKKRYVTSKYNLDLTYIGDRIIAMGFPSENLEGIYRNHMDDVRSFLEEKHMDHYKIYNLCSERSYDIHKFKNRVAVYPFDDHNPPEFGQMRPFCEDVNKWLGEHEENVAVVHCKAGKGRTGLMICAYLLHSGVCKTAEEVLTHYASMRTNDCKGVTIPSQRRYVDYYATMTQSWRQPGPESLQYNPVKMYLTSIVIDPLPQMGRGQQEGFIQFEVQQTCVAPYLSEVYQVRRNDGRINIDLPTPLLIVGDIKIEFQQKLKLDILNLSQRPRYVGNGKLFHFWVNTFFIDQQRTSSLTHDSSLGAPAPPASRSIRVTPVTPGWPPEPDVPPRGWRSAHTSGDNLDPDSPLPNPRVLTNSLSHGHTSDPHCQGSSEDQSEDTSPLSQSCAASAQTIPSHPPAKTVSIVDYYSQVGPNDQNCDNGSAAETERSLGSSDDSIIRSGEETNGANTGSCGAGVDGTNRALDTTHKSFIEKRKRHTSVPQTARTQGPTAPTKSKRNIPPGRFMSVRLSKNQIDKASKDKSGKFQDNFNVTLFLVRPNDQTLQAEFSRSNMLCQARPSSGLGSKQEQDSSDDSSEEEAAELRHRVSLRGQGTPLGSSDASDTTSHHSYHSTGAGEACVTGRTVTSAHHHEVLPAVRTMSAHLPSHLSGMVRNSTEPQQRLSEMTLSQSTWI